MAKIYNLACGAHISHKDVESWGVTELASIEAAIELLGNKQIIQRTTGDGEEAQE